MKRITEFCFSWRAPRTNAPLDWRRNTLRYCQKHYAYQEEWEKNNPGKEFDPDSEEHEPWYEANEPAEITRKLLDDGKIAMAVEEKYNAMIKPELDERKAKEAFQRQVPEIARNVNRGILSMVEMAEPSLAALVKDDKGNAEFTTENIAKMEEQNPIAKDILDEIARTMLEPMLFHLERSTVRDEAGKPVYPLQPDKNAVHASIDRFRHKAEQDILNAPDQQLRGGKQFATVEQMQVNPALAETHWCFTVDDLSDLIVTYYSNLAKQRIEKHVQLAKKQLKISDQPPQPPQPQPPTTATPATPAPPAGKPRPPSLSSPSDLVVVPTPGTVAQKTYGQIAAEEHFR